MGGVIGYVGECPRRARLKLSIAMSAGASGNATSSERRGRAEGDGVDGAEGEESEEDTIADVLRLRTRA